MKEQSSLSWALEIFRLYVLLRTVFYRKRLLGALARTMNVFTESELIIFFQVGSSNKGPSVGFVEVRGTPGDPVILYFYRNYSVYSACFEESTKTLEKINCLWFWLLKKSMTFTHAQYAEKKCTGVLTGRNCRFWSHLAVFRTESQYFYSNMYHSRLCIKRFLIYKKETPSYRV